MCSDFCKGGMKCEENKEGMGVGGGWFRVSSLFIISFASLCQMMI